MKIRMLPPDKLDGLPQEGDHDYASYIERMRALLNSRAVALKTNEPIPLASIYAYRFVPRPNSSSVRLQVQLHDGTIHVLDGGGLLYSLAEHGFLPDPRTAHPRDVNRDGVWHAYYPQLFAIPKRLTSR